jgi:hypothetical protein
MSLKNPSYETRTKLNFLALRNRDLDPDTFLEIERDYIEVAQWLDHLRGTGVIGEVIPDWQPKK